MKRLLSSHVSFDHHQINAMMFPKCDLHAVTHCGWREDDLQESKQQFKVNQKLKFPYTCANWDEHLEILGHTNGFQT
jgi:hypothetical protein